MVVLSIKYPDGEGFLFETTTSTRNDELIESLTAIHNCRLRARVVVDAVRSLASYGPMKKPDEVGMDYIKEQHLGDKIEKGINYNEDPTGQRTGSRPDTSMADILIRTAQDLEDYIDKSQISKGIFMTQKTLDEKLMNVRGAVVMAYPEGLPAWDTLKIALDSDDEMNATSVASLLLQPGKASLWAAGKEFERGKLVSDRLGSNEKTKVIAKLQKIGSGPPGREPIITEEEQRAMMAHYFKRQEELKKLAEADDDDYLNSEWADPKQMKRNLQGLGGSIKAPGFKF